MLLLRSRGDAPSLFMSSLRLSGVLQKGYKASTLTATVCFLSPLKAF